MSNEATIEVIPEHGGWVIILVRGTRMDGTRWTLSGNGGWHWSGYPNPPWGSGKFQTEGEARAWLDAHQLPEHPDGGDRATREAGRIHESRRAPTTNPSRSRPMPRKKKSQQEQIDAALDAAIAAGEQYANDQLTSDHFQDWVHEQMAEAAEMERRQPGSTISDPRQIARNMLQQLKWDIHRDVNRNELSSILNQIETGDPEYVSKDDLAKAFFDGLDQALDGKPAKDWLTDEVKYILGEMTAQQELPGVSETDDWLTYNTQLAKYMQRLKRDAAATSIAQNYRGTGSRSYRRQLWIHFKSGAVIDVWLENGYAKLGGVVNNRPSGGEPLTTRTVQYAETPEQTYEAVVAVLNPWANPVIRTASTDVRLPMSESRRRSRGPEPGTVRYQVFSVDPNTGTGEMQRFGTVALRPSASDDEVEQALARVGIYAPRGADRLVWQHRGTEAIIYDRTGDAIVRLVQGGTGFAHEARHGHGPEMTRREAEVAWKRGNDNGEGYPPYTDVPGDDTIDSAVAALREGRSAILIDNDHDCVLTMRERISKCTSGAVLGERPHSGAS
jgi:hypothetical protein